MKTTHKVGKDIDSWCTKCKLLLAHTIETMVGTKITKVHCNTCKAQHAYRANPPGESTRKVVRRKSASANEPRTAEDYEGMISGRDRAKARRYSTADQFASGELLAHPSFGLGIITASKDHTKIEVLFPDGPRVLAQGR